MVILKSEIPVIQSMRLFHWPKACSRPDAASFQAPRNPNLPTSSHDLAQATGNSSITVLRTTLMWDLAVKWHLDSMQANM